MVVGLLTPYFPDHKTVDSGIANHNMILAKGLSEKGVRVIIIHVRPQYDEMDIGLKRKNLDENIVLVTCPIKLGNLVNFFFKNRWTILDFVVKIKSILKTSLILERLIKEYKIDIIEASSYFSLTYFSIYKKFSVPVILRISTLYCQILNDHSPYRSRLLNIIGKMEINLINHSPDLITHAKNHAKELSDNFGIRDNIKIIPHGIDLPQLSTKSHPTEKNIKILYAGRLEYRKGTDILLAAIPYILSKFKDVDFEILGIDHKNHYYNEFKKSVSIEILNRVSFKGRVNDEVLKRAYNDCDIFVAPSRYESFGLVYIEAMSYGKPVIGAKVGGVAEIIDDYENGLFFELENPQDLADKIIFLINNKDIRSKLGFSARQKIENYFTKEILSSKSINYYESLLVQQFPHK